MKRLFQTLHSPLAAAAAAAGVGPALRHAGGDGDAWWRM
jgi:hypothetical protein